MRRPKKVGRLGLVPCCRGQMGDLAGWFPKPRSRLRPTLVMKQGALWASIWMILVREVLPEVGEVPKTPPRVISVLAAPAVPAPPAPRSQPANATRSDAGGRQAIHVGVGLMFESRDLLWALGNRVPHPQTGTQVDGAPDELWQRPQKPKPEHHHHQVPSGRDQARPEMKRHMQGMLHLLVKPELGKRGTTQNDATDRGPSGPRSRIGLLSVPEPPGSGGASPHSPAEAIFRIAYQVQKGVQHSARTRGQDHFWFALDFQDQVGHCNADRLQASALYACCRSRGTP